MFLLINYNYNYQEDIFILFSQIYTFFNLLMYLSKEYILVLSFMTCYMLIFLLDLILTCFNNEGDQI
jgi:hypothetical protein